MSLTDTRIVIIGGSSGIGLATAVAAQAAGASVIIASRSEAKLASAKQLLGTSVETSTLDIADEEGLRRFFEAVGEFDHLATPGAQGIRQPLASLDIGAAREAADSKLWGQLLAAKHAAPLLREGGSIVLFSGVSSQRPPAEGGTVPALLNSAVEGLGRALALELAPLRVNTVSPGLIDTPLYASMAPDAREAMFRGAAASSPTRRVGQPEDVAAATLSLMQNRFVTGTTLYVDGGRRVA